MPLGASCARRRLAWQPARAGTHPRLLVIAALERLGPMPVLGRCGAPSRPMLVCGRFRVGSTVPDSRCPPFRTLFSRGLRLPCLLPSGSDSRLIPGGASREVPGRVRMGLTKGRLPPESRPRVSDASDGKLVSFSASGIASRAAGAGRRVRGCLRATWAAGRWCPTQEA